MLVSEQKNQEKVLEKAVYPPHPPQKGCAILALPPCRADPLMLTYPGFGPSETGKSGDSAAGKKKRPYDPVAQRRWSLKYRNTPKGRKVMRAAKNRWKKRPNGQASMAKAIAKYRKSPRGKVAHQLARHRERARIAGAEIGTDQEATFEIGWEIRMTPTLFCTYCGSDLTGKVRHKDHIIALNLGGKHEADNLTVACSKCNLRKTDKPIEQWIEEITDPNF